jgi:hypothetical protein
VQREDQRAFRQADTIKKISRCHRDLEERNATKDETRIEAIDIAEGLFDVAPPDWDGEKASRLGLARIYTA